MGNPTRLPNGISTQAVGKQLGNFPLPDPVEAFQCFDDFITFDSTFDWTAAQTSTGATTLSSTSLGGSIVQTTAIGAADYAVVGQKVIPFNFTAAQQVWFSMRFQLSDVTVPAWIGGLTKGTIAAFVATPPTDGIYFYKAPASTAMTFVVKLSSTATSLTLTLPTALVAATYVDLGFYYNGKDTIYIYENETLIATQTTLTNLPVATALSVNTGIGSGAGAVNTSTVDYIHSAQDLSR